jgi:hypothetical protein
MLHLPHDEDYTKNHIILGCYGQNSHTCVAGDGLGLPAYTCVHQKPMLSSGILEMKRQQGYPLTRGGT